jgi:hypothetical protein
MKKKIILKRIFHRGMWRIFVSFSYDESLTRLMRQVAGSRFSNTHKSWYVDDNEETLKKILSVLRDQAEIDLTALTHRPDNKEVIKGEEKESIISAGIGAGLSDRKHEAEESEEEIIPSVRSVEKVVTRQRFSPVEFRINVEDGKLSIRFTGHYDSDWFEEIASYGRFSWDKTNKEFLLPWSVLTGDSLSDYFSSRGVEVRIVKSSPAKEVKSARKEIGDEIRNKELGQKAIEGLGMMGRYLDEVRYSERTNESYLALLELFFKFFHEKDPLEISMEEVSSFVYDFIIKNGYSASYQNQMISAIKTFYRIAGKKKIELELIERPRRSRALPKVFSKEEVKRILNSTRNTKHKLLLWIIYSCGLRRSEVTNIRLNDLDRDRSILHIREGKDGLTA